jgi:hypothetical protein
MKMASADRIPRREFLRAGAVGGLALSAPFALHESTAAVSSQYARNCILIHNAGGMSHLDLWDPKPHAPAEIRGEFSPIATSAPGVFISELLPHTARIADKLTIVRSVTHDESDHGRAAGLVADAASIGGSIEFETYVVVDAVSESAKAAAAAIVRATGFSARPRFPVGASRAQRSAVGLRDAPTPFPMVRACHPVEMCYPADAGSVGHGIEPDPARLEYGESEFGEQCLAACQMIEAGRRFVRIENGHWDSHAKNAWCLKEILAPAFDQAFSVLIAGLSGRGLLDSTLVMVTTEFGRSPRMNEMAGRDHWPRAFSIVLAGGGIPGGQTIGRTDKLGADVADRPVDPAPLLRGLRSQALR